MKLGHIVKYYNDFFKFDNGLYYTMPSGVITLCSCKFTIFDGVRSLSQAVLIKILRNFVTLLSTILSSSSLIMVNIATCLQEFLPFVHEHSPFLIVSSL